MFDKQKETTPFRAKLAEEFVCAVNAVLGDVADELDQKMLDNPELTLKDVLSAEDLKPIARKMEWYIYDDVNVFRSTPKKTR